MRKVCIVILILLAAVSDSSVHAGTFCVSGACFDKPNMTSGPGSSNVGGGTSRRQQRHEEDMADYGNQRQCIALMRNGNDLYDAGRYQEAYDFYIKAERLHAVCSKNSYGVPNSVNAMSMIYITNAEGARSLKDYGRCAEYVREAMSINPTYAGSWRNLLDRCSDEAQQAAKAKQEANNLNIKGKEYAGQEKWDEAISYFRLALQKQPDNKEYQENLARAQDRKSRRDMSAVIGGFAQNAPTEVPSLENMRFMKDDTSRYARFDNPQLNRLMYEADHMKVPPPLTGGSSPIEISDFAVSDETSRNILFGTGEGVATAGFLVRLAGTEITMTPKIVLALGRTVIAMEYGADLYFIKEDRYYNAALKLLKSKKTSPIFSRTVRAVKSNGPMPKGATKEMILLARQITDPKLGNSSLRIAWDSLWSPEAKAAGFARGCIEFSGLVAGNTVKQRVKTLTAAREPAYREAVDKMVRARKMLKHTKDPAERAALEEIARKADTIMVRSYDAGAIGMGNVTSRHVKKELERR